MKKFALFSCLLLALTITACARDATKPTKEASSKTEQTSAKTKSEDPFDKLTGSFLKMEKVKSFRAKTKITAGGIRTITTEFEAPDRFHSVSSASADLEGYVIEGTPYAKVAPDQWRKGEDYSRSAAGNGLIQASVDAKKLKADLDAAATKKFIGNKILDGDPTLVFEYEVLKYEGKSVWTYEIWIVASDGLPRKLDISAHATDDSPGYNASETNYYDYNANIEIEPPIK